MDLFYRQPKSFFSTIIAFFIAFILFYKRPQFSFSAIIVSFFIFLSLYITAPTILAIYPLLIPLPSPLLLTLALAL